MQIGANVYDFKTKETICNNCDEWITLYKNNQSYIIYRSEENTNNYVLFENGKHLMFSGGYV